MSIRVTVLYLLVAGLSIYAWKDWHRTLCGLIVMMAIIHHEDMPRMMFGIPGLNVWNALLGVIMVVWAFNRRRRGLTWDMPRHISVLLLLYLGVVIVGFLRAVIDRSHIEAYPVYGLVLDLLFDTVKWVLPAILLFNGCRSRKQVVMTLVCVLAMYVLLSAQVIKRMPWESALGGAGEGIQRTRLKICSAIGYSSCDMSTVLAGASWGMLAALPLLREKKYRLIVLVAAGVVTFGQALTGGRAGYAAWGATGVVLCLLKWRRYLLLAPVVIILLVTLLPGAVDRMLYGFGRTDATGQEIVDDYEVTSGRTLVWPYVIAKIGEAPIVGYGRLAMNRTGVTDQLMLELDEPFPHPHNMYLETLLDNGILGSTPIFLFWGMMLFYSARLFRSDNRLYTAVGGLSLALMLAQLFAGVGAQHFYPRESTFCVWIAMLLVLRLHVEERRAQGALATQLISDTADAMPQQQVAFAHKEEAVWQ